MSNSTNVTAASPLEQMLFMEASRTLPALLSQSNFLKFSIDQLVDCFLATASANVLLMWDIIITFEQEVELVWKSVLLSVVERK